MPTRDDLQHSLDLYVSAYRAADAQGCAQAFLPDAVMMSPYGPIARGRCAIEAQHVEWTREGSDSKELRIVAFGGSGDVAWALAEFSEGAATGAGTSLSVFERQPDGQWLIRICSLNAGDPPAP